MEWKDEFPRTRKPAYEELLAFFSPRVRELFTQFDQMVRERFRIQNKYHRFHKEIGWCYGYSYTFRQYRRSCNSDNVPGGRATPVFREYLLKWPTCRTAAEKFLLIDWLIHECHVTLMNGEIGRTVGINLIDGTYEQVKKLILTLAFGENK